MADTLIRGGTVVSATGSTRADVAVTQGRVSAIGPGLEAPGADVVDATGLLVLPGVVDVHTHTRLSSGEQPDRFLRDSLAAAHGGTTTFLAFNNPGTGISEAGARSPLAGAAEFRERTAGQSVVDFGLSSVIGGHQDDPLRELPALVASGVPTAKAFMVYDFRLGDEALEGALRIMARAGGMLQVHCEEPAIIDPLVEAALARGDVGCRHHALTRPPVAETAATRKAIEMARRAQAPLYIVHLSCLGALEAVAEAKARGEPVFAETCPHYLVSTDALYDDPDEANVIQRVISPPLRSQADVDALWAGLRDGILDIVASDHVPDRLAVEKHLPAPPFPQVSNGGPGIETLLSAGVGEGRLTVERLVDVLATAPARLFGLAGKGAVEVGLDADLVLIDPNAQRTLRQADLHHTSDYTPFEGLELRGALAEVFVRGHRLAEAAAHPSGHFLERRL
jgi:dihydropyrimidinase